MFLVQPFATIKLFADEVIAFLFNFDTGVSQKQADRLSVLKI